MEPWLSTRLRSFALVRFPTLDLELDGEISGKPGTLKTDNSSQRTSEVETAGRDFCIAAPSTVATPACGGAEGRLFNKRAASF